MATNAILDGDAESYAILRATVAAFLGMLAEQRDQGEAFPAWLDGAEDRLLKVTASLDGANAARIKRQKEASGDA